ncbi:PREDICTED: leucine-rich repeat flightless-interacting protein 1-like [Cyprinodon variegatus]|uniref:leucine-rich repeat flightless-interacting protein 1-like n=1 Tax=Cyprinodon variegatus TaxID=28743 RepID=UPI000742C949|nr:PREDICTED: leucine-rich repeat flightless-interacting protein 1-like [Cyprinodon variegatus]
MHSAALDSSGSPRKRTISRGMSEDESLRSIIKETESSSRRLPRSDSRTGTLRKRTDSQQSDQDLFMGLPEMLELQASYDEAVQELRGLEVEREALLFQVDVLQDTLEGVEELLAEAQREAGQANLELEQERAEKRKLESLVSSLMKEVERLREGESNQPTAALNLTDEEKGETDAVLCEPCITKLDNAGLVAAEEAGPDKGLGEAGSVITKTGRVVSQNLGLPPSLALHDIISTDGVLQRPYEGHTEDGRDPSPDRNDSDKSAYEDASAETPEQDRTFPGDGDLPEDSEENGKHPADGSQKEINPDLCVLS